MRLAASLCLTCALLTLAGSACAPSGGGGRDPSSTRTSGPAPAAARSPSSLESSGGPGSAASRDAGGSPEASVVRLVHVPLELELRRDDRATLWKAARDALLELCKALRTKR